MGDILGSGSVSQRVSKQPGWKPDRNIASPEFSSASRLIGKTLSKFHGIPGKACAITCTLITSASGRQGCFFTCLLHGKMKYYNTYRACLSPYSPVTNAASFNIVTIQECMRGRNTIALRWNFLWHLEYGVSGCLTGWLWSCLWLKQCGDNSNACTFVLRRQTVEPTLWRPSNNRQKK